MAIRGGLVVLGLLAFSAAPARAQMSMPFEMRRFAFPGSGARS